MHFPVRAVIERRFYHRNLTERSPRAWVTMQLHRAMKKQGRSKSILEAYRELIHQPSIWRRLGLARQTVLNYRSRLKQGAMPEDATMRRILKKGGWRKVLDEQWAPRPGRR